MECQECHQRPATHHLTQFINGNKTEIHVCSVCAKENGYMTYPGDGYSLQELLTGLFNFESSPISSHGGATSFSQATELQCPQCELTFTEFKRIGKFGCAECYHTFSDRLDPILRRVHSGNTKHHGKIPIRNRGDLHTKKELVTYKAELQKLIVNEEFEEAAKVRDKIKDLEKKIGENKAGDNS